MQSKNLEFIEDILKKTDEEICLNRLVYKIPKHYIDFIKSRNLKFSRFVVEAIEEKINKIKGLESGKK